MLRVAEPAAQLIEWKRLRLVADVPKRGLEIGDQPLAEGLVGDRAGNDVVELAAAARKLLSRADPAFGRRREGAEQLSESHFVVWAC
jgi:hypothetical protein